MRAFLLFLAGLYFAEAFAPIATPRATPTACGKTTTSLRLTEAELAELPGNIGESRIAFFIWFFGASGAAGIARSAFPRMYRSVRYIQDLKGEGPSLGGETIGVSPICGYPEDFARADVEKIINNRLTVEQIVKKFPIDGNFLSSKGYLCFEAFELANKGAKPLVVRGIFDAFAQSTDICNPDVAQEKLDAYKVSLDRFKGDLLKSKLTSYSAVFLLLFLLGLADIVAFGHAYDGWFPDWPGGRLDVLPGSLIDPEMNPFNIPKYWI